MYHLLKNQEFIRPFTLLDTKVLQYWNWNGEGGWDGCRGREWDRDTSKLFDAKCKKSVSVIKQVI